MKRGTHIAFACLALVPAFALSACKAPVRDSGAPAPSAATTQSVAATETTGVDLVHLRLKLVPRWKGFTQPVYVTGALPVALPAKVYGFRAADETPFAEDGRLRSRVEELAHFARRRGMRKVGVAFCVSMRAEAQRLADKLEAEGLDTALVCCRVGAVDAAEVGLPKTDPDRFTATCNPVAQARLLDEAQVELVAAVGLCLGHDLVLQEESVAPVTTLVVKDRVHDHHPIAALR